VTECADDLDRFAVAEGPDVVLQLASGRRICIAVEPQCRQSNALDRVERPLALLGPDRFPKDPAEQRMS
jgi:hypothetical protein